MRDPAPILPALERGGVCLRKSAIIAPWIRSYTRFLVALAILYLAGYAALLYAADGLPYVLDNNESFSTLLHARNLYEFGLDRSKGLTDEATGPNPAAHPYVHTHQGNFPRIFSLLLYLLGARTVESQIVVTTFTIGALGAFLAFHVFSRLAGPLLAFVISVVLLSDYIHVAQWQVNTYRVWQLFLVFSSLVCVYGIGGRRRRLWLVLTYVNAVCLFYCELISVAFTALLAWFFLLGRYWRQPRLLLAGSVAQVAGGLTALTVLAIQLVLYMGWDQLLVDISMTYGARNLGADPEAVRQQIDAFYHRNRIIFWYNFVDGTSLRSISSFVDVHARLLLQVYTPLLTVVTLVLVTGWLLGLPWGTGWLRRFAPSAARDVRGPKPRPAGHRRGAFAAALRAALLLPPWALAAFAVLANEAFAGVTAEPPLPQLTGVTIVSALAIAAVATFFMMKASPGEPPPLRRYVLTAAFLLGIGLLIVVQPSLYDQAYRGLWFDSIVAVVPTWVLRVGLLLAIGLATIMTLFGTKRVLGEQATAQLRALTGYLACALAAYVITYLLATGYVYSGYLKRSTPLGVFVVGVLVAFAACVVVAASARAWTTGTRLIEPDAMPSTASRNRLAAAVPAVLLGWLASYWVVLNASYLTLIPPDQFSFLKRFDEPPFLGKSAVVNNYAIPVGVQTGNWAYYDILFGGGETRQTDQGFMVDGDRHTYLWLADKRENQEYLRPDYFVCMRQRTLESVAIQLAGSEDLARFDCASFPLVRRIETRRERPLANRLVDRDPTIPSSWAIVQLDWDFPPFLAPLDGRPSDERVGLVVTPAGDELSVQVEYRFVQQDSVPEQGSIIRLHASGADKRWCVLARSTDDARFSVPVSFRGTLRASVTPRTATKSGTESFGQPVMIGDGQGTPCTGR